MNAAANLLQRVGTQRPQTAPCTPLSFGSPVDDLTPQRTTFAVHGSEVVGSTSETARRPAAADLLHRIQVTGSGSVDCSASRRREQQSHGTLYD